MLGLLTYPTIEIKPDNQAKPQSVKAVSTRSAIPFVAAEWLHTRLNPERPRLVLVELDESIEGLDTEFAESIVEAAITLSND